jgi:hypothetical protein
LRTRKRHRSPWMRVLQDSQHQQCCPQAQPSALHPIAPQPPPTAHRAQHQPLRAQRRQHGQLERPAQLDCDSRKPREAAAPARNRTDTYQHRVSCSMVNKMEALDSAQRLTSPRSQQTAHSTYDPHKLSMRSAVVCSTSQTTAPSRLTTRSCGCTCVCVDLEHLECEL